MDEAERAAKLDTFYGLLSDLAASSRRRLLAECNGRDRWPKRGVYFFMEPGEFRAGRPNTSRIVRVGTHAVSSGSKSTLWGRLRTHRGGRGGTGNHRGSIFRRHVGAALLARDGVEILTWGVKSSASRAVRAAEAEHERRTTVYLGAMTVCWLAVPDEPNKESLRSYVERNSIALLSNRLNPTDPPSANWLGSHSPYAEIRQSGLWNLNYVSEEPDARFLAVLEELVRQDCSAG
jgi:hypothetical protein